MHPLDPEGIGSITHLVYRLMAGGLETETKNTKTPSEGPEREINVDTDQSR